MNETPAPGIRLIRVSGVLGGDGSARLLRMIDSQLMLASSGHRRLQAVIIDMEGVEAVHRGGPEALSHIRYACDRRGIDVVLAGCLGPLSTSLSLRERLRGFPNFPTAQAALAALESRRLSDVE
ncbi:STAS domain-containing protein [Pseudonocardia sp. KRD291]|uniref:STAS domain-containing protein n=1 Tax=Pseudonocardia sp. KRD291 TaxID=2792007 RepID=UPI001C4A32A8|nr:STAS domain-containing protein [Pseudonocardia sp. KRD291]MBW0100862.1 STAS domain-containing protein [Pseudonocardia sp. KRD291]